MKTTTYRTSGHTAAFLSHNKATPCGPQANVDNSGVSPLVPHADADGEKRSIVVKFRLTEPEVIKLYQMLPANGKGRRGISRFVRERLFSIRRTPLADNAQYRLLERFNK